MGFLDGLLGGQQQQQEDGTRLEGQNVGAPVYDPQTMELAQAYGMHPALVQQAQAERQQAILGNLGATLLAAGQGGPVGQRGQILSKMDLSGGQPMATSLLNSAQMQLYAEQVKGKQDERKQQEELNNWVKNVATSKGEGTSPVAGVVSGKQIALTPDQAKLLASMPAAARTQALTDMVKKNLSGPEYKQEEIGGTIYNRNLGTNKLEGAAGATTNINTTPGPAAAVYKTVEDRTDAARSAAQALPSFSTAKQLIDSGEVTLGAGADARVGLQKIGGLFGLDTTAASNTEFFKTQVAPQVLAMVKGLGSGAGISNADREFAERMAGGNINLEPATIKRLMDIGERASRAKIAEHNKTVDAVYPEKDPNNAQVRSLFRVDPEAFKPAAAPAPAPSAPAAAPAGLPMGAQKAPDGHYYVPDPNRPGKYLMVQ